VPRHTFTVDGECGRGIVRSEDLGVH
jgi:hypothetical protein